ISLTVSLIAVLIPLLFMGDVIGRLFREFAVTLAVSIVLSAFVSLTLTPMLSARWLKKEEPEKESGVLKAMHHWFDSVIHQYDRSLTWVIDHGPLTLIVAVATLVLTIALYVFIPKGLFPQQDTGLIQVVTEASQSVSYARMAALQEQTAGELLKDPDVE